MNAAPAGASAAMQAVRDGGRLATITGDPPHAGRGVAVISVVVVPDGPRLRLLAGLLGQGAMTRRQTSRRGPPAGPAGRAPRRFSLRKKPGRSRWT